jgi:hypothetical protein
MVAVKLGDRTHNFPDTQHRIFPEPLPDPIGPHAISDLLNLTAPVFRHVSGRVVRFNCSLHEKFPPRTAFIHVAWLEISETAN